MSRIAGSCGRLCLKSLEAAKFFSKVTVSFYLITRSIWKFQLFYIIANKPGRMIYLQKLSCKQVLESTWNKPELWSVQFSRSVGSNSLRPHGLQHTRLPCPSPTPGACSNSCPLSQSLLKLMSTESLMPLSRWAVVAVSTLSKVTDLAKICSRLFIFPLCVCFSCSVIPTLRGPMQPHGL